MSRSLARGSERCSRRPRGVVEASREWVVRRAKRIHLAGRAWVGRRLTAGDDIGALLVTWATGEAQHQAPRTFAPLQATTHYALRNTHSPPRSTAQLDRNPGDTRRAQPRHRRIAEATTPNVSAVHLRSCPCVLRESAWRARATRPRSPLHNLPRTPARPSRWAPRCTRRRPLPENRD